MTNAKHDAEKAILNLLDKRPARFAMELLTAAEGATQAPRDGVEQALSNLESRGAVVVRRQYCDDPHLEGVDLRIVALAKGKSSGQQEVDPLGEIDALWRSWLTSYMASHRCE